MIKPEGLDETREAIKRLPHEKLCVAEFIENRCECSRASALAWLAAAERNIFRAVDLEVDEQLAGMRTKLNEALASNKFLKRQLNKEN